MSFLKIVMKGKHSKSIPSHNYEKLWFSQRELWKDNTPKASLVTDEINDECLRELWKENTTKASLVTNERNYDFLKESYEMKTLQTH